MKTLIFTLSTPKCGTKKLAKALSNIGLDSGHERLMYELEPLFKQWVENLFFCEENVRLKAQCFKNDFWKILRPHLEGEGYYCNISHYFSWYYPIVKELGIPHKCIHITRNPKRMLLEYIQAGRFGVVDITHYGGMFYPPNSQELKSVPIRHFKNSAEMYCFLWKEINNYYQKAGHTHFKVEDFNTEYKNILLNLYPEYSPEQLSIFKQSLYKEEISPKISFRESWEGKLKEYYNRYLYNTFGYSESYEKY